MTCSTTQEQLVDLWTDLTALEAVVRTQRIVFFKPLPKGDQQKFFEGQTAIIRLVLGDNRSGKTECGVVEAIAHSLGYRPWLPEGHPLRIVRLPNGEPIPVPNVGRIIATDFQQAVRQVIWPKFTHYAPAGWYKVKTDNRGIPIEVSWNNESKIYILSNDQEDDVVEGTSGTWFWGDEPVNYKKFIGLRRGLVDRGGHCWLTLTPLSQPWIADVLAERGNDPDGEVKIYELDIWHNCTENGGHLTREAIEAFIRDLREDQKAARIGRQFLHLTGRVFKEWKPEEPYWVEPFEIPDKWPRVCVIDPHPRKPVAVLWMAVSPDNQTFVYRELFDENLVTIQEVADKIRKLEGDEVMAMRLIDPSSQEQERTSGDSVHRRFARCGIRCALAKKRNIEAGLDAIHEALRIRGDWQEPGLVVFNNCPVTKRNFLRFVYEDWATSRQRDLKGEKQSVRKTDDDMIACIRYRYQMGMSYHSLRRKPQVVDEDKERGFGLHTRKYYGVTV